MRKKTIITGLVTALLLASLVAVPATPFSTSVAEAGVISKIKKKAKKAAKSVKKSAKKAGKSVKKLAKKGASAGKSAVLAASKTGVLNAVVPVPIAALVAGAGSVKTVAKGAKKARKTVHSSAKKTGPAKKTGLANKSGMMRAPTPAAAKSSHASSAKTIKLKRSKNACLRKLRMMGTKPSSTRGQTALTRHQKIIWRARYTTQKASCR